MMKTNVSDHFLIVFVLKACEKNKAEDKVRFIYKRIYGENQTELFQHELSQIE